MPVQSEYDRGFKDGLWLCGWVLLIGLFVAGVIRAVTA